jgi:hypothetical protein
VVFRPRVGGLTGLGRWIAFHDALWWGKEAQLNHNHGFFRPRRSADSRFTAEATGTHICEVYPFRDHQHAGLREKSRYTHEGRRNYSPFGRAD